MADRINELIQNDRRITVLRDSISVLAVWIAVSEINLITGKYAHVGFREC